MSQWSFVNFVDFKTPMEIMKLSFFWHGKFGISTSRKNHNLLCMHWLVTLAVSVLIFLQQHIYFDSSIITVLESYQIFNKNSSEDEIAKVNSLYDDIIHYVLQNTIEWRTNSTTDRHSSSHNAIYRPLGRSRSFKVTDFGTIDSSYPISD